MIDFRVWGHVPLLVNLSVGCRTYGKYGWCLISQLWGWRVSCFGLRAGLSEIWFHMPAYTLQNMKLKTPCRESVSNTHDMGSHTHTATLSLSCWLSLLSLSLSLSPSLSLTYPLTHWLNHWMLRTLDEAYPWTCTSPQMSMYMYTHSHNTCVHIYLLTCFPYLR